MYAADVMTKDVITVRPTATVREVAQLLLDRRISAAPVVGSDGKLLGIVSEGDLIRRAETETDSQRSWWDSVLTTPDEYAAQYVKEHGRLAEEVMTRKVFSTSPAATLRDVADILQRRGVKRLPVLEDGRLVGIVSRADILRGLVASPALAVADGQDDRQLCDAVIRSLTKHAGTALPIVNAVVQDGVVQIRGLFESDIQERAAIVAAENVPGVRRVESRAGRISPWAYGI